MANAQIYQAGQPVVKYGKGAGDTTLYTPPFGRTELGNKWDRMTRPPFDAHFNGAAGQVTYPAGQVLAPAYMKWQYNNIKAAKLAVGDVIQMLLIPTNHWVEYVRFDVCKADTNMAGATVTFAGLNYNVDPADPYDNWLVTDDADVTAAVAAQSIVPIPLDVPSSTFLSLVKTSVYIDVDAAADYTPAGYIMPKYVPPEFATVNGELKRFQTGGFMLGIKIVTLPTNTDLGIEDALHDFYLTTRVNGFECHAMA
jgi:hypothetical protein